MKPDSRLLYAWIVLRAARPTPWTAGQTRIDYYPSSRILYRDGERFLVPEGLARVIEEDGGLLPAAAPPGDFPWAAAGGAAGAFLVALAATLAFGVGRRRRARAA